MALFHPQNENDFLVIKSGFNARLKPSYLVVRARFFFVNEYFGLVYYYCIWFEYLLFFLWSSSTLLALLLGLHFHEVVLGVALQPLRCRQTYDPDWPSE